MRYKRRYVCIQLIFAKPETACKFKISELNEDFTETIEQCFGDFGLATLEPSFSIVYYNANTNMLILRTSRRFYTTFRSLLIFKKKVKSTDLMLNVLHASGSLKKARQFLVEYSAKKLFSTKHHENKYKQN
jgi:RNase P/RNase MRP subunit POP5